ncbi:hypothetical protein [Celeribacter neptunius]|uniref:DUF3108 domain-containing protein n=1 Tax=Celeribacter neptunius TaxID=588602 RepID=A0A1I3Y847_9RHOB|nr:hypothetical protein [Celeribacter neptunius]SFK28044.1 hypothetical protein SAMN04487991_4283 [Celeribacter neptunius]
MRKILTLSAALSATLACFAVTMPGPVAAANAEAPVPTYDLLFRQGTLDRIGPDAVLHYRRVVTNHAKPEAATRDTGEIALSFAEGETRMARLQFLQDEKHRSLGRFPASVGNPMIMVFYESVIRDMAETAGGSPYYIRNRVKEALVRPAEIETGQARFGTRMIDTRTVTLRPFAEDPNRDRMQGFGDLELRVTMSEEVPGWYLTLVAEAPDATGAPDGYLSELRFDMLDSDVPDGEAGQ